MAWRLSGAKPLPEPMLPCFSFSLGSSSGLAPNGGQAITRANSAMLLILYISRPVLTNWSVKWRITDILHNFLRRKTRARRRRSRTSPSSRTKPRARRSVGWFNIKMSSYQYRKSHCGDKTILRPSYLHNGIPYTGKMTSLYWIRALQGSTLQVLLLCTNFVKMGTPEFSRWSDGWSVLACYVQYSFSNL